MEVWAVTASAGVGVSDWFGEPDDKQGLSIPELFLLPDQLRDGLLRAILLEGIQFP